VQKIAEALETDVRLAREGSLDDRGISRMAGLGSHGKYTQIAMPSRCEQFDALLAIGCDVQRATEAKQIARTPLASERSGHDSAACVVRLCV
jgi:hypothetical protein